MNRARTATLVSTLVLACLAAPTWGKSTKKETMEDILTRLEDIDARLTQIQAGGVGRCTRAEKDAGNCDQVRETTVNACFDLEVLSAELVWDYKFKVSAKGEGGIGWTSGPDGKILLSYFGPVGPVPSEFGVDLKAPGVRLNTQVCIAFPIDLLAAVSNPPGDATGARAAAAVSVDGLDELQTRLEEALTAVFPRALEKLAAALPSGPDLERGFETFQDIGDGNFDLERGVFDQSIRDVVGALPTPSLASQLAMDPGVLAQYLPAMDGDRTVAGRAEMLCGADSGLSITRFPLLAETTEGLCSFVEDVPQFDDIAELVPLTADEVVDAVTELLGPVFANTGNGETVPEARSRFCSSAVGGRRAFDRLCGR